MSDSILDNDQSQVTPVRTDAISALGILGFINTGICMLLYGIGAVGLFGVKSLPKEEFNQAMEEGLKAYEGTIPPEQFEQLGGLIDVLYESGGMLMLVLFALTLARFIAILRMWKLRSSGFLIYAGAQAVRLFVPILFLGMAMGFSWLGAVLIVAMVFGWHTQRKYMA